MMIPWRRWRWLVKRWPGELNDRILFLFGGIGRRYEFLAQFSQTTGTTFHFQGETLVGFKDYIISKNQVLIFTEEIRADGHF